MKNRFARNSMAAAITVALAAMAASTPTLAVNHSDTGLGEVGLVPYYTVRGGYDTWINVVNTSPAYVVAFKIRFHESVNSRDARDFNVFLSPNDVWSARVTLGPDGKTPQIRVPSDDQTCTAPWTGKDPSKAFVEDGGERYLNFTKIAYTGGSFDPKDSGPQGIERAQEGYVEIIEMGVADPGASALAGWAVHGKTQNCSAIAQVYPPVNKTITVTGSGKLSCNRDANVAKKEKASGEVAFQAEYCEPLNVLKVAATLLDVSTGLAASMPITTLANFYNPAYASDPADPAYGTEDLKDPSPKDLMLQPQDARPWLADAEPPMSIQINNGKTVQALFNGSSNVGADAVSSLFSSTDVVNEYQASASGGNAWVVTFPTKGFYVDPPLSERLTPFEEFFGGKVPDGKSCVTVNFTYYDREENKSEGGSVLPSPPPVDAKSEICYESQTLNFNKKVALLDSQNNYNVTLDKGYDAGWMRLGFPDAGRIAGIDRDSGQRVVFKGLPAIGFSYAVPADGVGTTEQNAYYRSISVITTVE